MPSAEFLRKLDELQERAERLGAVNTKKRMRKAQIANSLLKISEKDLLAAISKLLDSFETAHTLTWTCLCGHYLVCCSEDPSEPPVRCDVVGCLCEQCGRSDERTTDG